MYSSNCSFFTIHREIVHFQMIVQSAIAKIHTLSLSLEFASRSSNSWSILSDSLSDSWRAFAECAIVSAHIMRHCAHKTERNEFNSVLSTIGPSNAFQWERSAAGRRLDHSVSHSVYPRHTASSAGKA